MSDVCGNLMPILRIVAYLIKIVQWAIPAILIALIMFDFFKGMTTNDDKVMEQAKSLLGKRIVYAVVVFLVPILIRLMFNLIDNSINSGTGLYGPTKWISCFNQALREV